MQPIIIDNLDDIFNVPSDRIRVIHLPDNDDRRRLHQYLETTYPKLNKVSLYCNKLESNVLHTYIRCYDCDYSRVNIDESHDGIMSNNIDEYCSGECPRCNAIISFEPHYEGWDDVKTIKRNNVIAFGSLFQGYNKPKHSISEIITKETILRILNGKSCYQITIPDNTCGKRAITKYINEQL